MAGAAGLDYRQGQKDRSQSPNRGSKHCVGQVPGFHPRFPVVAWLGIIFVLNWDFRQTVSLFFSMFSLATHLNADRSGDPGVGFYDLDTAYGVADYIVDHLKY